MAEPNSVTVPYTGYTSSNLPATVTTTPTVSPAVITSKVATNDINDIKTAHADITAGIANQAATVANNKAVADTAAAQKAQMDAATKAAADKTAIDKQNADAKTAAVNGVSVSTPTVPTVGSSAFNPVTGVQATVNNIGQNSDGSYTVTFSDSPNSQRVEARDITKLTDASTGVAATKDTLAQAQADYQAQAKQVQDTITNITNGTIPLNDAQVAQVNGLKQQFQQLIDQQVLTNTGASGVANIRGYQKGAAEYDPTFQAKVIGGIVTAGLNKISDLNVKMASAVASLTEGFKTNNISRIKDAYSVYQDASKKRTDAIQKTIDDTQKVIKDAQDAKIAADKVVYDTITKPIDDIAKDAAKNGASQEVVDAIRASKDAGAAISAAGDFLQTGTGIVGEYQFYARQEKAAGRVPMDFNKYQTLDANRKIALTKASTASEKKSGAYGTINQLLGLKNAQGIPYLDGVNGYFTPQGFAELVLAASEDGISRKDFLEQYGSYLAPTEGSAYNLTAAEKKALGFK